jgi:hypothetical protein
MSSSRWKSRSAMAMLGAALLALLTLDGCSEGRPQPPAPPPMASAPPPAASPELMGGPAAQPATGEQAAAEQPAASQQTFTPMAPIANPEDMAPQERVQVYGHRYDRFERHENGRSAWSHHSRRHAVRYYIGDGPRAGHGRAIHHRFARHGRWRYVAHRGRLHHAYAGHHAGAAQTTSHHHKTRPAAGSPANGPATAAPTASGTPPTATPAASAPAPTPPDTQAGSPSLDWLSIPGTPYVYLPGFGRVASKFVTAAGLLLLAIILLAVAAGRGRTVTPRRRPVRSTVGAGPAFAEEPRTETAPAEAAPVAPFPHHESSDPTLPPT